MIKRFFELQEKVLGYYPEANTELLKKAYSIAAEAHMNQKRATKEPYITHPLSVAGILADMRLDEISIAAGLLHDIVEDTSYSIQQIKDMFGEEIADIVWGVTKISKISDIDAEDARAETLKKMIIAMTSDVRVILIKLADRLHNIRTLDVLKEEKRKRIAEETLEIYAPIAYRLGMGKIKDELENVAFKYAYSEEYAKIHREVGDKKSWAIDRLEALKEEIQKIFKKYQIPGEVRYRIKREVSIYNKIKKQDISIDKVFDLLAIRIITDTVENCYTIMGDIHQRYQHIPSRWRDFITNPKSNGYQSIHTTIVTQEGIIFEIQIRTREMDDVAEEGIAAHWSYKEGISFLENDRRLDWFRDLIENHKSHPNPRDFLSLVKMDLTPDEIYVFTPKGKVINLKAGSIPVDFAYAIHTEVGNHCKGSIVNERLVPLRTELNSGDVVEILTSKNTSPSSDWLKFVVTSRARKKITGYFQRKENILFVEKGKRVWARILRDLKKKYKINYSEEEILEKISRLHYTDMESFFRDIGSNKRLLDRKTLKVIFPKISAGEIQPSRKVSGKMHQEYKLVEVEGYQDIDILFAKCCNPIKGDDVVGYMTQNRGLVIHNKNCTNVRNVLPSRLKKVNWNQNEDHSYQVKYDLIVQDRPGILSAISSINADYDSNIKKIENEYISQIMNKIKITFEVTDTKQLQQIANKYRKIKDIYSVMRKRIAEK
ncbi:MAG: bifunctional (p)ppGpp synthetase/guanosine-3',5'-bis(diphosphate) 3'-pyrophosphohydrolase [Candidatus Aminicenantes bacterium]|nr:bifunctional (p)ppGpp synthetase/guanosine-3',5'-bis(diphosphate) 3'-pyrophosphohydrolase [Candidatus Aminicenantes bacterium]